MIKLGLCCLVVFLGFAIGVPVAQAHVNKRVIDCTVVGKDPTSVTGGSAAYRIETHQCGMLKNEDSNYITKDDSTTIQQQLVIGDSYAFTVVGWKFVPLAQYPNVVSVEFSAPTSKETP